MSTKKYSFELFFVDFEQVSNYKGQRPLYTIRTWPLRIYAKKIN